MTSRSLTCSPTVLAFVAGVTLGVGAAKLSKLIRSPNKLDRARKRLYGIVGEGFTGALILTGDKLGLYEILYQTGSTTADSLARRTGWSERWLLEWLSQSAAAGICSYSPKTNEFHLKSEYASLLRDPMKSKDSVVGLFTVTNALQSRSSDTAQAIMTGIGVEYDHGDDIIVGMDRQNWNYFQNKFIDEILLPTKIPSTGKPLAELLEKGSAVADVGCGCGASTVAMARRFPKSRFYAYELSRRSLAAIEKRLAVMKLNNIVVCDVSKRSVGDGPDVCDGEQFGFVYAHDVLHDMTHPRELIKDVKKRLSPDGCWIAIDGICGNSTAENLRRSHATTSFGFSCLLCLASATSSKDGEGLGTMGLSKALTSKWMKDAGFTHCIPFLPPSLPENQGYLIA
mmetsp:Transcript_11685/g.22391  ORF Transcript_11685/g.22391 Transcript_11685/m.22391 type:complete len:398 (+) Transcript_11685:68-1261(+)|eukprot:scaffold528_cov165-Amphora_coffeaeformis.AAC.38